MEDEEERRLKREAGEVVERSRSRSPQRRRDSNRRSRSPDSRRSCERRGRSRPPIEKPSTEIRKRRRFASKSKSRSPVKKAANGAASPKDNFVKNGAASAKGSSVSPPARKSVSVSPPRRRAATPSSE